MRSRSTGELAPPFAFAQLVFIFSCLLSLTTTSFAQAPADPPVVPATIVAPTIGNLVRFAIKDSLTEVHVDDRHWNQQAPRWDGVHIRGLRMTPRTKQVNHGFWRRYKFWLIEPEESLRIDVVQEPPLPDGSLPFALSIGLKARCEATFAFWSWGVKGLNGTAVADVQVTAHVQLLTSPGLAFSVDSPLPQVKLRPRIGSVQLRLRDIRMHELGILDGQFARIVGDGAQEIVEEVLKGKEQKVKEKLQKKLEEE